MIGARVVIGAGPAGLAAAGELARRGVAPLVLERGPLLGGLARTEEYGGYRFDMVKKRGRESLKCIVTANPVAYSRPAVGSCQRTCWEHEWGCKE